MEEVVDENDKVSSVVVTVNKMKRKKNDESSDGDCGGSGGGGGVGGERSIPIPFKKRELDDADVERERERVESISPISTSVKRNLEESGASQEGDLSAEREASTSTNLKKTK